MLGAFFVIFGIIETVLVLSIDGVFYPFQWGDVLSTITIFSLLALIFAISLLDTGTKP